MIYLLRSAVFLISLHSLLLFSITAQPRVSQNTETVPNNVRSNKGDTPPDTARYQTAPDFTLETMDGETFTLSDHKGKIIVLNFWATWCGPCREEIPGFIELQKEMDEQEVLFVGLAMDEEGWEVIRPYAQKMNINYPVIWDKEFAISKKYGPLRGIPTTFIINRRGGMEYIAAGMLSKSRLFAVLKKMIAG